MGVALLLVPYVKWCLYHSVERSHNANCVLAFTPREFPKASTWIVRKYCSFSQLHIVHNLTYGANFRYTPAMSQIPQLTVSAVPQLTVSTQNAPGELARITEILAQEDANIEGMTQTGVESSQVKTHVVVDKAAEAKKVLESQGLEVSQTDILAITCASDQPGLIATVARALGNAGINIENAYYSSGSRGNKIVIYVWVAPAQLQQALEVVKGL